MKVFSTAGQAIFGASCWTHLG